MQVRTAALLLLFPIPVCAFSIASYSSSSVLSSPRTFRLRDRRTSFQRSSSASSSDEVPSRSVNRVASSSTSPSLNRAFFAIAFPAFLQLTAEPLASIVDTAYLGRLGADVLGGAGVAISASYAVGKLYNDPLLRSSISLVAAEDGKSESENQKNTGDDRGSADVARAVSGALLLASVVGIVQGLLYTICAPSILVLMGCAPTSPMYHHALGYLRIRSLGTPAATLWLVANGVYRGLGDTATPLKYSLAFTAMNAALDPLFIFGCRMGAAGAAAGTALAQYAALIPLLFALNRRMGGGVLNFRRNWRDLGGVLAKYCEAGGLVMIRTLGKVAAYSVCARQAALLGPIAAAAYNLTFQIGFATTQICESVAVAVQTLLAREFGRDAGISDANGNGRDGRRRNIDHLIRLSVGVGGAVSMSLSLATYCNRNAVLRGLTTDASVRAACLGIFPAVLATQVLKGLAYPVNGIIMGGLDWKFSMLAMWLANAACIGILWATKAVPIPLNRIWWSLAAFMGVQVATGVLRFRSKTGVWKILKKTGNGGGAVSSVPI